MPARCRILCAGRRICCTRRAFDCTLRGPFDDLSLTRLSAARALCKGMIAVISASTVCIYIGKQYSMRRRVCQPILKARRKAAAAQYPRPRTHQKAAPRALKGPPRAPHARRAQAAVPAAPLPKNLAPLRFREPCFFRAVEWVSCARPSVISTEQREWRNLARCVSVNKLFLPCSERLFVLYKIPRLTLGMTRTVFVFRDPSVRAGCARAYSG